MRVSIQPRCIIGAIVLLSGMVALIAADTRSTTDAVKSPVTLPRLATSDERPNLDWRLLDVGDVRVATTNFGIIGGNYASYPEDRTPSFEFPSGSRVNYLFQAGLWVGGIRGSDTLVSAASGYLYTDSREFNPCSGDDCLIWRASRNSGDPDYSIDAVADVELQATCTDTVDVALVRDEDAEKHTPLNICVRQRSMAWGGVPSDEFVLIEYVISIMGHVPVRNAYIGIYLDGDAGHLGLGPEDWAEICVDDWSGSRYFAAGENGSDSVLYAWVADDDGDPAVAGESYAFDNHSATGAMAVALLGPVGGTSQLSFNWWNASGDGWGPCRISNCARIHVTGYAYSDADKYAIMSNGELDYDQIEMWLDHTSEGWQQPPSPLSRSTDTQCLISFGPLTIYPGKQIRFGMVLAAGYGFHRKADDFAELYDRELPFAYRDSLDFSVLDSNIARAKGVFDYLHRGDVNWNGKVDIGDLVDLVRYLYYGAEGPSYLPVCDVNQDGSVGLADAVAIAMHVLAGQPL